MKRTLLIALLLLASCGMQSNAPSELFRRTSAGSGVRIRASLQRFPKCVEQLQIELSNPGKSRNVGAPVYGPDLRAKMYLAYFAAGVVAVHTTSNATVVAWHYDATHFDEMKPVNGWAVLAGEVSFLNASVDPYLGTLVEALDGGGRVLSRVSTAEPRHQTGSSC